MTIPGGPFLSSHYRIYKLRPPPITLPTKTITHNSKGEAVTTQMKYITDFTSATTWNVYNEMLDRNIVAPLIEQSTSKNSINVNSIKNKLSPLARLYCPPGTSKPVLTKIHPGPKFHSFRYDNLGNLLSVAGEMTDQKVISEVTTKPFRLLKSIMRLLSRLPIAALKHHRIWETGPMRVPVSVASRGKPDDTVTQFHPPRQS